MIVKVILAIFKGPLAQPHLHRRGSRGNLLTWHSREGHVHKPFSDSHPLLSTKPPGETCSIGRQRVQEIITVSWYSKLSLVRNRSHFNSDPVQVQSPRNCRAEFAKATEFEQDHLDTAETQDRTGDLQIFSLTLSQLSYRGAQNGRALAYRSTFLVHKCNFVPIQH